MLAIVVIHEQFSILNGIPVKKAILFFIIIAAIVATPFLFAGRYIKGHAEKAITQATGFQTSIGFIDVGIIRPFIHIKDAVLLNPPGFPHSELMTLKEVFIHYDRWSLFSDELRFQEVRVDIPRVVMVKPEHGESNIEVLSDISKRSDTGRGPEPESPDTTPPIESAPMTGTPPAIEKKSTSRAFIIDSLHIKLGEMEVRQYREGKPEPVVIPVTVGLDRTITNVKDFDDIKRSISSELLARSAVSLFSNMDTILESVTDENGRLDEDIRKQLKDLKKLFD